MVIGVEGNVHVGKTTYINNSFKEYNIIKESLFNPTLNNYERQLDYIKQELEKKKYLEENTILDRTIISIIIYTMYTNTLTKSEKNKLMNKIKNLIKNKEVIIPSSIYLVIYPYKLLSNNHLSLKEMKKTQDSLVDYNYYINYSLFFANRLKYFNKIINIDGYREIISYNSEIFNNITRNNANGSKVLIDYSTDLDNKTPINTIVKKINSLSKKNIVQKNSFLIDISCLLYSSITRKNKLENIDKIMSEVCLNNYVTKIIYVSSSENNYVNSFYKTLHKRLGDISNISFITRLDNKLVSNISDKPLMLIDLFYEIKEGIKEGDF